MKYLHVYVVFVMNAMGITLSILNKITPAEGLIITCISLSIGLQPLTKKL